MGGATHSKTKGSKRVKLHRELAELLIKELRRHGTCGEMIGEWKDEGKDHDIVGPRMVIIMDTEHDKDDKHRKTMEENRIVRQRTKMQHQQNKGEMDEQDEFLKEQMNESVRNRLDVEEAWWVLQILVIKHGGCCSETRHGMRGNNVSGRAPGSTWPRPDLLECVPGGLQYLRLQSDCFQAESSMT